MQASRTAERDEQSVWAIDPTHSTVAFTVQNFFFFKIRGSFAEVAGTMVLDEEDVRDSSVEAAIKAASISTGSKRRDAHLRGADFLDVERYPEILFRSTQVEPGQDRDTLRVTGELMIKGKTRAVILAVDAMDRSRSPQGEEVVYYTATTEIDRFDFGITHGRLITGRKLPIVINVQAMRQT
jgi:polyisoprenoid-binding protein YceI